MSARAILTSGPGGKDTVMVASKEELSVPSKVTLPEPEPAPGLILPDGSINWGCPCLGGMATGPCGTQFRDAFSCFHYSEADPKGSDCYEKFSVMQDCMSHYPELYGKDEDDELAAAMGEADAAGDKTVASGEKAMAAADDRSSTAAKKTPDNSSASPVGDAPLSGKAP